MVMCGVILCSASSQTDVKVKAGNPEQMSISLLFDFLYVSQDWLEAECKIPQHWHDNTQSNTKNILMQNLRVKESEVNFSRQHWHVRTLNYVVSIWNQYVMK